MQRFRRAPRRRPATGTGNAARCSEQPEEAAHRHGSFARTRALRWGRAPTALPQPPGKVAPTTLNQAGFFGFFTLLLTSPVVRSHPARLQLRMPPYLNSPLTPSFRASVLAQRELKVYASSCSCTQLLESRRAALHESLDRVLVIDMRFPCLCLSFESAPRAPHAFWCA